MSAPIRDTSKHGAPSTSYRRGCRCDECRATNTRRVKARRKKNTARLANRQVDGSEIKHGRSAYTNWGCRCEICIKAHSAACKPASDRWRREHPEAVKEQARRWAKEHPEKAAGASRRLQARKQASTLESADHHYQQWTSSELELAGRDDLTVKDIALATGRTFFAAKTMRQKLRAAEAIDPEAQR